MPKPIIIEAGKIEKVNEAALVLKVGSQLLLIAGKREPYGMTLNWRVVTQNGDLDTQKGGVGNGQ